MTLTRFLYSVKFLPQISIALFAFLLSENSTAQFLSNQFDEGKFFENENASNQRLLNFFSDPRANNINIYYQRLELTLDPDTLYVKGSVSTSFTAKQNLDTLYFDLYDSMVVDSVLYHNSSVTFHQPINNSFWILLPSEIISGANDSVKVFYQGIPSGDGMGSFTKGFHNNSPCLFNLSEPYAAMFWWPCKQSLTDKIDSIDIIVHHPSQYKAASNGLLISEIPSGGLTVTHWKHVYPIAPYLIGVSVSEYSVYEDAVHFSPTDSLIILNYVFPENLDTAKKYSANLIPVMKFYAETFGDYPFKKEKYGHAQWTYGGGMEHQTMSFVGSMNFSLISHELAHQWFGDHLTCGTWRDIWLNEGFATYCTGLCIEKFYPNQFRKWKEDDLSYIKDALPQTIWVWDTSWNVRIFDSRLTYAKGAYLLHMLRWKLGDSDFFAALKSYQADPNLAYNFAVVPNLIQHLQNQSGQDLTQFFNQWYYGGGYPTYHLQWNQGADNNLKLYAEQETSIPESVPFFTMPIPVEFIGEGQDSIVRFDNDMNGQFFTVTLPFKVDSVSFDPDLHLISFDNTVVRVPGFEDESLSLFPNPSGNAINLFYSSGFIPTEVTIYDLTGREIYTSAIDANRYSGKYTINASTLASAVYFIKVKSDWSTKILKWVKAN